MPRQGFVILVIVILNIIPIIKTQHLPFCDNLNEIEGNENNKANSEIKIRRIRALCDAIYPSKITSEHDDGNSVPDFDLTKIDSGKNI